MKLYEEGYKLADNELLLKIRPTDTFREVPTGFLTKLTQKGRIPSAFAEWPNKWNNKTEALPIYIVEEKFRSGWKLHNWCFGESQNWASLIHPDGYTVEVYLQGFLEIIKKHTLVNGELKHDLFKWENHNLIKQEVTS